MAEYIDREKARNAIYERIDELRADKEFDLAKEICVSGVKKYIRAIPTADVVEREKIDKAIEEIEQTLYVDSLIFGELIDFKDGKISADDVIEEFNRVTRKEVLEIIKRNVGEKTNESND